jgi:hypothetical protein
VDYVFGVFRFVCHSDFLSPFRFGYAARTASIPIDRRLVGVAVPAAALSSALLLAILCRSAGENILLRMCGFGVMV